MIRTVIAEDEPPARDKLTRWVAESKLFEVVSSVGDGLAAANAIATLQPDVAFLDIRMPGLSGIELAAQFERTSAPLIVFVTAFDEYAVQAFDLSAIDYILKPYDRDRFDRAIERITARLNDRSNSERAVLLARQRTRPAARLLVPDGEQLLLIDTDTIEWLEAADNYVHVHTATKGYLMRRTLQDLLDQLGEDRFVRIHKSVAVHLAFIASMSPLFKGDYEIHLRSGRIVRMSRRYKDALFARLGR